MIRRAQISDVAELVACVDDAYSLARNRGVELPPVSEGLDQDIRDHLVWVSVNGDQIVGAIVVSVTPGHAHLMNIAVRPEASGHGLAKALIQTALEELRRLNVARFDLATHVEMPENVSLYTHLGWVETDRSATKVHMSREID